MWTLFSGQFLMSRQFYLYFLILHQISFYIPLYLFFKRYIEETGHIKGFIGIYLSIIYLIVFMYSPFTTEWEMVLFVFLLYTNYEILGRLTFLFPIVRENIFRCVMVYRTWHWFSFICLHMSCLCCGSITCQGERIFFSFRWLWCILFWWSWLVQ